MFNEYDNVRNPMLGAYLLWSFVLGYFSEKNEATPLEELFIVLPMTMKEDIAEQIKSTNKASGMRAMSDKFMKTDVLKNDLISNLHNDIQNMINWEKQEGIITKDIKVEDVVQVIQ